MSKIKLIKNCLYALLILLILIACSYYFFNKISFKKQLNTNSVATVTIAFDDDDESIYTEAYPIMKSLNLKGTNYCITGFIGKEGMMTKEQLQVMYDGGWTIGNHTSLHWNLKTRNDKEIVDLVKDAQVALVSYGWSKGAYEFVPPENQIDDRILSLIKPYINSSTNGDVGLNNIPIDKYHIARVGVANKKPEEIEKYVDDAIRSGKYLHLNFHKIGKEINPLTYPVDSFTEIMKYIALKRDEGSINVKTMYELNK